MKVNYFALNPGPDKKHAADSWCSRGPCNLGTSVVGWSLWLVLTPLAECVLMQTPCCRNVDQRLFDVSLSMVVN